MKSTFLLFSLILMTQGTALAHDSSHYVCTGYVGEGGDRYGFAIQFDESRADDGVSRNEMLSSVWAGELYQGVHLNTEFEMGDTSQIVIANKTDPSQVFYEGRYQLVEKPSGDGYDLGISGSINLSPSSSPAAIISISTVLNCVDIST